MRFLVALPLFALLLACPPPDDDDDSSEWTPTELTPQERCVDECDQYAFYECIDPDRAATCRQACAAASEQLIESFLACDGALDCDTGCVDDLAP